MPHICDWKVVNDNSDGRMEVCKECHRKLITRKDTRTGRIDNRKYLKEHIRDTAQPHGRTGKIFKKYYGDGEISRFK